MKIPIPITIFIIMSLYLIIILLDKRLFCIETRVNNWIEMECELPKELTKWKETKTVKFTVNEVYK